jgi:MSHA biogenesis protein MshK
MRLARLYCCLLTSLAAVHAIGAEADARTPAPGLSDPTRPPFGSRAPGAQESPPAGPELQSVLLSATRNVAVISGRTVPLGGRFGDATLTRITETGVELRNGSRVEVLRLFPRVRKSPPGDEARRRD